ncbi:homoserine dehydrogenase [Bacillus sp. FJAT-27251]|uniref:homoserine dehydrogenase n=1 Tax=Bacillus sp. FJAT-27251 TaxID=1684142 RepID=UPI0006A7DF0F|nr:homoserine dehydrogenase [Bacillus sp. FJAT-27251]
MNAIKVAILGFGTVGEGVYRTVETHQEELAAVLGKKVEVVAILIKNKQKDRGIGNEVLVTDDFEEIMHLPQLDVIVEAIVGREPAFTYLQRSIQKGCHVITANKEMFAFHGEELKKLAEAHHVSVGFEATVAGGVPVIQTIQQLLNINRIKKIEGILNGTSNYILSEMRVNGQTFPEALKAAQDKGYAEADPTNDVEGFDAFYKLLILSEIAFGEKPVWENVQREGISSITEEQITQAENLGLRFKLIASVQLDGEKVIGSVRPTLVTETHPLFNIEGVENSVSIEGDIVGRITLQGPGAGMLPTASAVIEDLIHAVLETKVPEAEGIRGRSLHASGDRDRVQNWLIMPQGDVSLQSIPPSSVTEIDSGYFLQADEQEISALRRQNRSASIFEVLGDYAVEKTAKVYL